MVNERRMIFILFIVWLIISPLLINVKPPNLNNIKFPEFTKINFKTLKMPRIIKILIGIAIFKLIWAIDVTEIINKLLQ